MAENYIPISSWAEDDKPREKMLSKGVATLSTNELLAILIRSGCGGESALDLSRRILLDLSNDLNTSMAITVLYDVLKDNDMNDDTKLYLINDFDKVLSLDLCVFDEELKDDELACYIQNKIEERNLAKQNKDYAKADKIRDELKDKNVIIRDTRDGTVYEIIR